MIFQLLKQMSTNHDMIFFDQSHELAISRNPQCPSPITSTTFSINGTMNFDISSIGAKTALDVGTRIGFENRVAGGSGERDVLPRRAPFLLGNCHTPNFDHFFLFLSILFVYLKSGIFVVSDKISAERYFKIPHLATKMDSFNYVFLVYYLPLLFLSFYVFISFLFISFLIFVFIYLYY